MKYPNTILSTYFKVPPIFTDFARRLFDFGDDLPPETDCIDPFGLSVWYESKETTLYRDYHQ